MPILGFSPGVPSNTPNIVTDCENFIPYESGMEAAPTQYDISASALAAAATGAVTVTKLDGGRRTFVGTDTKLYELNALSFVDVSKSASSYVSGSIWSFAQFGDTTLASNDGNPIQSCSTASFSAIVGAPTAKIVETVVTSGGGFAFAFNTSTAADGWHCSALNDCQDWSVSVATQSTTGRLLGAGGEIVAAKKFGADGIVAYKRDSMAHARYVGGSVVWAWQEIPVVGAAGLRCVADVGFAHFIVAQDGFYLYDGARPIQIGTAEIRQWFSSNVNAAYIGKVEVVFDKDQNRVWIFFPYGGSTTLNRALVWHIGTQQWGLVTTNIETALVYTGGGITFDGIAGTFDEQTLAFDSPLWTASTRSLAAFNTAHKLVTYTGTPAGSYFMTADFGQPMRASRVTEAFLEYAIRPTTAKCSTFGSFALGGIEVNGPANQVAHDEIGSNGTPGRFTLRQHARYHRLKFDFSGACRVTGYAAKVTAAGGR